MLCARSFAFASYHWNLWKTLCFTVVVTGQKTSVSLTTWRADYRLGHACLLLSLWKKHQLCWSCGGSLLLVSTIDLLVLLAGAALTFIVAGTSKVCLSQIWTAGHFWSCKQSSELHLIIDCQLHCLRTLEFFCFSTTYWNWLHYATMHHLKPKCCWIVDLQAAFILLWVLNC